MILLLYLTKSAVEVLESRILVKSPGSALDVETTVKGLYSEAFVTFILENGSGNDSSSLALSLSSSGIAESTVDSFAPIARLVARVLRSCN